MNKIENIQRDWLTIPDAAHYLGRTVGSIRNLIYRGLLDACLLYTSPSPRDPE